MWSYAQIGARGSCQAHIAEIQGVCAEAGAWKTCKTNSTAVEGVYTEAGAWKSCQTRTTDVEMFWPLFYRWKAVMPIFNVIMVIMLCLTVLDLPRLICEARGSFTKRAPMRRQVADVASLFALFFMIGLGIYASSFETTFAASCMKWHSECSTAGQHLLVLHVLPLCCQISIFIMDMTKFSANAALARMVDEHGEGKSAEGVSVQLPSLITRRGENGKSSKTNGEKTEKAPSCRSVHS